MKHFLKVLSVSLLALTALADDHTNWPYPEDTPKVSPVDVGLAGQMPADITRFLMVRGAGGTALSKDGKSLAFTSNVTGSPQLWIMDAAGGQPKQLTYGNGVTFFRWHPDGEHLIYGADNNGDEREAYYMMKRDGLSERQLMPFSDAFRRFGSFSSDGSKFSFASTERNGRDFDIYEADTATGESRLLFQAEFGYFPASYQPNGDHLIITQTVGEDANNVFLLNTKNKELKTLFKPEVSSAYQGFAWAADGSHFYYSTNQDREYTALAKYDLASGKVTTLYEGDHDVEAVRLNGDKTYLSWQTNHGGYSKLHVMNVKTGKMVKTAELPDGVYSTSWSEGSKLSVRISAFDRPGDVFVWDVKSGDVEQVYASNLAGLNAATMVKPESITFKARDGVTVQGLLYLPKGVKKPAVVVDVHGGPTAQARPVWLGRTQYLVGKGIAVLDINVRGSTGFGKTYARLDNMEKRRDSVRDLADAIAWMKEDGRVDGDRAAVMGGSYGGYMVNAVMGLYPEAFKAGASFVGVSNWVRALEEASPGLKASDLIEYGDIREEKWQKFYAENSPINNAHRIKAPMFFEHGVNDPRDPVTESDRMVKVIRDNGFEVEYLRFPDEGHSVRKMKNRITYGRRLAAFLEKHLAAEK
ncbi:S9 family peptidase [Kordiimonas laminariae]|uniref:S9 family peptidase n=1 Tax=Kordiimonas laminariae TaxID=2917717 RepID=UPI001FF64DBE|nr:S9 family peptidase [Kordiimonas laminariae]MCK0067943.1 S9 family peptidase [Kordiimonas laminariae]